MSCSVLISFISVYIVRMASEPYLKEKPQMNLKAVSVKTSLNHASEMELGEMMPTISILQLGESALYLCSHMCVATVCLSWALTQHHGENLAKLNA